MQKSVYSLVLSDGVVEAVDRLAYLRGSNRSQVINEILAEYVSYVTPEQRIREVFGRISSALDGHGDFRLMARPSDTMLSLGSALVYKYNPTVRYSVELFRTSSSEVGELRVSLRTQNLRLTGALMDFYALWAGVEEACIGPCDCRGEDGRFCRRFRLHVNRHAGEGAVPPATLGELIAAYIRTFDRALKCFFAHSCDAGAVAGEVAALYAGYLAGCTEII